MGKIVGIREQLFWTWWDTALSATGPCKVENRLSLFGSTNVGYYHRTNMRCAGMFPGDMTFSILSAPMLVSFENERLFGVFGRGAKAKILVGDKVVEEHPLPTAAVRSDQPPSQVVSDEDFVEQCDVIVKRLEEKQAFETDSRGDRVLKVTWREAMAAAQRLAPGGLAIPIRIPVRQMFEVELMLDNEAAAIIGESGGAKSIVQCLRGVLTRDVY